MFADEKVSLRALALGAAGFVALTVALTLGIQALGVERIRAAIADAGALAPLLYMLVRASTMIIAPLSSGPLQFSAGVMFGLWEGLLYSLVGEALGGSVNFWIARLLGRPVVARFVGKDGMGRVERFYRQAGEPLTLIYARLFLFAIYDFVSYAAGLTTLRYWHYLVITLVGGVVPTLVAVGVGTSLTGSIAQLVLMYAALALISIVTFVLYGRVRKWLKLEEIQKAD